MGVKAAEFSVVAEARRAAEGQMRFFNSMMAVKSANAAAAAKKPQPQDAAKKSGSGKSK